MFLRQIVLQKGIPFEMKLPRTAPLTYGSLTKVSDIFVSTHSEKYIAAVNSMNNRTAMGQGGPDKLPNLLVYRRQKNYSNNPAENPLHKVYQMYRPLAYSLLSEAAGILTQTEGDLCIPGEG